MREETLLPSFVEMSSDARCICIAYAAGRRCEGSFVRPEDLGRKVEINKSYKALITAANPDGDRKVTASIRHDTEFRAWKYVLQARGLVAPVSRE